MACEFALPGLSGLESDARADPAGVPDGGGGLRSHPYSYGKTKPEILSKVGAYPPDSLTQRVVDYIKLPHRRPYFLMFAPFHVHTPVETPCLWLLQKYRAKIPPETPNRDRRIRYAAFVETLDHQMGEVLKAVDETGKREKSLVVFTSDNGGHPEYTANAPLRGSKWNLYEGGIRVPFIVRWPGKVPAGEPCRVPVSGYDPLSHLCGGGREAGGRGGGGAGLAESAGVVPEARGAAEACALLALSLLSPGG